MKKRLNKSYTTIVAIGCIWIVAHLLAPATFMQEWWPFTMGRFTSLPLMIPGILIAFAALISPENILQRLESTPHKPSHYYIFLFGLTIAILGALAGYSVSHNFFGDGNLIKAITSNSAEQSAGLLQQNIKVLINTVASIAGWSTEITFRTLSIAGGVAYYTGIVILVAGFTNRLTGILVLILLSLQPWILFFTDYNETYPVLAGMFVLYLALSVKLDGTIKNNCIITFLYGLLIFLHPIFSIFVLSHIARFFHFSALKNKVMPIFISVTAVGVCIYILYSAASYSSRHGTVLLPVFPDSDQVYTIFSIKHMTDFIKLMLFLFSPAVFLLIPSFKNMSINNSKYGILFPYAITALIFIMFADFKLGALDWDVVATILLPAVLYPVLVYTINNNTVVGIKILFFIVGLSLARIVPWLVINGEQHKAADYVIHTAKYDVHQKPGTRVYSLATRLREAGLQKKALELSINLDTKDGDRNVVARNNLAQSLIQNGKYNEALVILKEITTQYPDYFHGNANLGELYIEHFNQPDSAYKYLGKAILQRPDAAHVLYALAFIELRGNKIDEAKIKFERVIELNPLHSDAHVKLGMILLRQGSMEKGVACYDKALKLGGVPGPTIEMICRSYNDLGLTDRAKNCYDQLGEMGK